MKLRFIFIFLIGILVLASCTNNQNSTPKPKTYFRIEVPEPNYLTFDTLMLPFTFQYPDYGTIEKTQEKRCKHQLVQYKL